MEESTDRTAYAHDPVTNEDVPIECSTLHQSTDYDRIDGESLPVLIESDFRHDPVEGCQGTATQIIALDDGCPNCGYDRANSTTVTLAGVHALECRACGVDLTDAGREDWTPSRPTDPVTMTRRHGDYLAEVGTDGKLYERNAGLYGVVKYGDVLSLSTPEVIDIAINVLAKMDENSLSKRDGRALINTIVHAFDTEDEDDE